MQENFRVKGKKLYFGFVDLEKAFDRVPREVIQWALHKLGVEEWLVSAVMSMYTGAKTVEFRVALPWELLYADDLVVIAETEDDLIKRLN